MRRRRQSRLEVTVEPPQQTTPEDAVVAMVPIVGIFQAIAERLSAKGKLPEGFHYPSGSLPAQSIDAEVVHPK